MSNLAKSFEDATKEEKLSILKDMYIDKKMSWNDIAKELGKNRKTIAKIAKSGNLESRTRSESQKLLLETGKINHPTAGRKRTEKEKEKISKGTMKQILSLGPAESKRRADNARKQYEDMSIDEKKNFHAESHKRRLETAKTGSKLEKFLLSKLLEAGFHVEFHKEHFMTREKLQIDLFLPTINTAIEVDGIGHFEPIYGQKCLIRAQRADKDKTGLVLGAGCVMIRITKKTNFTKTTAEKIAEQLLEHVQQIKSKFPPSGKDRVIEIIGD